MMKHNTNILTKLLNDVISLILQKLYKYYVTLIISHLDDKFYAI